MKETRVKGLVTSLCIAACLAVPAAAAASEVDPIAGVKDCPPGYVGYIVYVQDRDIARFCIPFGP